MVEIYVHGKQIESVFELLGTKENDITYSIGWALANSPAFLTRFVKEVLPGVSDFDGIEVLLQEFRRNGGITDIELVGKSFHVIIEAKRGWNLPNRDQFGLYSHRLGIEGRPHRALVCMSECSKQYATFHLPKNSAVQHLSWKDIVRLAETVIGASHAEKRLLGQLSTYLRRIVNMQDQRSNIVWVVSLGSGVPDGCTISWVDVVVKCHRYFHPAAKNWPTSPPNYIGFRYSGKLQSIHHIDSWKIVDELHKEIKGIGPKFALGRHFCYSLGPAIVPAQEVRAGNMRSGRAYAALDLLLTSPTVLEAIRETHKRLDATNA